MKRKLLALLPLFVVAACSDDPTGNSGDQLTRAEALAIANGVMQSSATTTTNVNAATQGDLVASPPTTITTDHESSHPCPVSGQITLAFAATAVVDAEAHSFELDAEGVLTHDDCAFRQEAVTLTVDGDPNLRFEMHAAIENNQPKGAFTAETEGAFEWSASDGRSGRCVMNLLVSTDFAGKKHVADGEVCGHSIKQTVSWG